MKRFPVDHELLTQENYEHDVDSNKDDWQVSVISQPVSAKVIFEVFFETELQ